uniref:Uncharacterized protein n=1 Tax=Octopus bimaculoides TaxID=37653 RepID=A0A0L8HKU0_OCTBM
MVCVSVMCCVNGVDYKLELDLLLSSDILNLWDLSLCYLHVVWVNFLSHNSVGHTF